MCCFLTEKQAAEKYGLSVHWFRRKRWAGGGPSFIKTSDGPGGKCLYPVDELEKYFTSRIRRSTSDQGQPAAA